ncbi:MAG: threonine/serine exporter family protein [Aureliella sp.]
MVEETLSASSNQTRGAHSETHAFIIKVGMMLHQFGTPAHRLERIMAEVAQMLGTEGTFLYTPTALVLSIGRDDQEVTYLRRVDCGNVDVDKLIRFDETLEHLEASEIGVSEASRRFDEIAESNPLYPTWLTTVACAFSCAAVATLFRGGLYEIIAAAGVGLSVGVVELIAQRLNAERGILEPLAGFVASVGTLATAHYFVPIDDRLATLAGLIILIPGLGITVALTELAVGHLSAGVARLAGSCVSLLTIIIGVAFGWRVAAASWRNIPDAPAWPIPEYWQWAAMVVAPLTFAIVFRAKWPQWPTIIIVTVLGFLASRFAGDHFGVEVGAFCGALAVGASSNVYARARNRPALVPLTPGIIVLVPGSVGFRSLAALLDHETVVGIEFAFTMVIVAASLVGGILAANAIVPPKRIL